MSMAAKTPQALRYVFSDIWNGVPSTAGLPVELWPYISAHRVFAGAPPSAGIWKTGHVIWRQVHKPARFDNGSIRVAAYPEYEPFQEWEEQPFGTSLGWVCAEGGEPGKWINISSAGLEQVAMTEMPSTPKHGGEEVIVALRSEVADLRKMVEDLVGRLEALENVAATVR